MINQHRLYTAWTGMKSRCHCKTSPGYKNYGARGISVDPAWRDSFRTFVEDIERTIGPKPSSQYSLDRIDNNGNYELGNLRWATRAEQSINRRIGMIAKRQGRPGVTFCSQTQRWVAKRRIDGVMYRRSYVTEAEATAYLDAVEDIIFRWGLSPQETV